MLQALSGDTKTMWEISSNNEDTEIYARDVISVSLLLTSYKFYII